MSPRLAFASEAAFRAGRSTLAHYQTGVAVDSKNDATPVTIADREAESLIRREIAHHFPGEAILGEEEGGMDTPNRWIIDPIDGTKSFVSGVPLYATLLSYEENGVPIVGVSYFPALDEMVYAEAGGGAFFNGRPCRVSTKSEVVGSVLLCGGLKHMDLFGRLGPFLELSKTALATRTWGDAYGHALVATGRAEAMVDPVVSRWDISAMDLILREAGGTFTKMDGSRALEPAHADGHYEALSTNGILLPALVEAFQR